MVNHSATTYMREEGEAATRLAKVQALRLSDPLEASTLD